MLSSNPLATRVLLPRLSPRALSAAPWFPAFQSAGYSFTLELPHFVARGAPDAQAALGLSKTSRITRIVPEPTKSGFLSFLQKSGVSFSCVPSASSPLLAPVPLTALQTQHQRHCGHSSRMLASEAAAKKPRMNEERGRRIGTHNGTFHCDEALGCFLLKLTEKFKDAEIVRTRDQKVLEALDAVLDVGGVYDPEQQRFDHHQRGFDHVFGHGFSTKLSSAGLVYKHFGREIIAGMMGLPVDHKDVDTVYLAVYKNFIEAVDAVDNGVNQYVSESPPLYQNNTHLGSRVARLNPDWLEENSEEKENAAFRKAMELTGSEFVESVTHISKSWLPARSIVAESLKEAKNVHSSGEIVVLSRFCPWKLHLAELEGELQIPLDKLPKYVVYEDDRSGQWRVQAVSVAPGSFASRVPLLEAWRGHRDEELSNISGIPGCVFVHSSGFIGGNRTKDGAIQMANMSLIGQCSRRS